MHKMVLHVFGYRFGHTPSHISLLGDHRQPFFIHQPVAQNEKPAYLQQQDDQHNNLADNHNKRTPRQQTLCTAEKIDQQYQQHMDRKPELGLKSYTKRIQEIALDQQITSITQSLLNMGARKTNSNKCQHEKYFHHHETGQCR
jgi:hypothetical protein